MNNRVTRKVSDDFASNCETIFKEYDARNNRMKSEIETEIEELFKNPSSSIDEFKSKVSAVSKLIRDIFGSERIPNIVTEERSILQK